MQKQKSEKGFHRESSNLLSSSQYDEGPTLYFYSLKHNMTIKKIPGGEIFIDFIQSKKEGQGKLYYLTDQIFVDRWHRLRDMRQAKNLLQDSAY